MKMIKIDVSGMMSEKCVDKINEAIKTIHGIKMVDAVLNENAGYIIIKNNIDIEGIKNIIRKAGYIPGLHISWVVS